MHCKRKLFSREMYGVFLYLIDLINFYSINWQTIGTLVQLNIATHMNF
jgi:hypothetical protein